MAGKNKKGNKKNGVKNRPRKKSDFPNMKKQSKAQATIEFLLNYGWAIVIIVTVLSTLSYLGIITLPKAVPDLCIIAPGLHCSDFEIKQEQAEIEFVIKNNLGDAIRDVKVTIPGCTSWNSEAGSSYQNDEVFRAKVTNCALSNGHFKLFPIIEFSKVRSGLDMKYSGEIRGRIGTGGGDSFLEGAESCSVDADCTPGICTIAHCVDELCTYEDGADGVLVTGEECDDGNNDNGDGCSSSCMVEEDYFCYGMPSVCIDSLVAWWKLDDNLNEENGGHHGTFSGGGVPNYVTGRNGKGKALELDGISDYVTIGADPKLNIQGAISLEAWVNYKGGMGEGGIISNYDPFGFSGYKLNYHQAGPSPELEFNIRTEVHTTLFTPNTWKHIIATWDGTAGGSDEMKIYIDGVPQSGLCNFAVNTGANSPVYIGLNPMFAPPLGPNIGFWEGTLDEVRIWKKELSAAEVSQLYALG